jgi:hypothetical protein
VYAVLFGYSGKANYFHSKTFDEHVCDWLSLAIVVKKKGT